MDKLNTADYLESARNEMIQARISVQIMNAVLEINMAKVDTTSNRAERHALLQSRVAAFREMDRATQNLSVATARHASALALHYGLPLEIAF